MAIFRGIGGSLDGQTETISLPVAISQGGTGQTDANKAFNALVPDQTSKSGRYLKSDGTNTSWDNLDISTADISGVLPIANGGTGTSDIATARDNLGLEIGVDIPATTGTGATGTWAIAISGNAANVTDTVALANGGTGATTASNARVNLLPSYTGNGSKVLALNAGATDVEWTAAGSGAGNVVGPASATDGAVALFDGTTGKLLKNGVVLGTAATVADNTLVHLAGIETITGAKTFSSTITGSISGSAATLATGRTVAITGDLAYTSGSFDGSGNVTGTGTLATVNSNTGSFGSTTSVPVITVNGKGLITAVSTATVSSLPSQTGNAGKYLTTDGTDASWGTVASGNAYTRTEFTATASQTTFSVTYTVGLIAVYVNGVLLNGADYTASNGTSVVLSVACSSGDIVEFIAFSSFSVASTVSSLSGGTTGLTPSSATTGNVTLGGTLAVANGGTGVTTSTGSGAVVLGTSPTLTSPTITGAVVSSMASSVITSGTAVASTSGTSIDFTGIPSWVQRITVMFNGVSTNGTSNIQIQIGSGSVTTTGYSSQASGSASFSGVITSGFVLTASQAATYVYSGKISLNLIGSNTWIEDGYLAFTSVSSYGWDSAGNSSALSGALDRVRITTVGGTNTFDAGSINIMYE